MKQEDTKQKILDKALELFSARGYDCVSVGRSPRRSGNQGAVGFTTTFRASRQFSTPLWKPLRRSMRRIPTRLTSTCRTQGRMFRFSLRLPQIGCMTRCGRFSSILCIMRAISRFRRMMTIEQFRSSELAALYSRRYVERVLRYHAGIFRALIASGEIRQEDPDALALQYVAPVLTLIGVCDRQPEREGECLEKLRQHVELFFRMVHAKQKDTETT